MPPFWTVTTRHSCTTIRFQLFYRGGITAENRGSQKCLRNLGFRKLKFCGGTQQNVYPFLYPKIPIKFKILGKRRWPFGYEILRQLKYPKYYCRPEVAETGECTEPQGNHANAGLQ